MKKGFIISFEGGEASGKSTQVKLFKEYLEKEGIKYISTREPGGTPAGELIRNVLLNSDVKLNHKAETLLFNASRTMLCEEVIKPALERGEVVVLDRFFDSTYVYEALSIDKDYTSLTPIIEFATDGIKPDLTILLNQDAKISYQRKVEENKQDRFEQRGLDYYKKIQEGYLFLAQKSPERIKVIDATMTIPQVHEAIINCFEKNYK